MKKPESSVTGTLSRAHAALLENLHKVKDCVSANAAAGPAELRAFLSTTRAEMVEHFRAQERHSSMDAIQSQQPYLSPAIHRLADEHRALTESLDVLMDEAARATAVDDGLRHRVRDWIGRVRQHEAHEIDFLQNAVDQDIGEKD